MTSFICNITWKKEIIIEYYICNSENRLISDIMMTSTKIIKFSIQIKFKGTNFNLYYSKMEFVSNIQ